MKLITHLIWFGSPIPAEYLDNITQFKALNPEMDVRLWGKRDMPSLKRLPGIWWDLEEHTPADSFRQLQSDLARLAILHEYGGLYIDTDFEWRKPIVDLLHPSRVTTVWERERQYVANGFMYAPRPGHPVIGRALATAEAWIHARSGQRANRILGPSGQWTRITSHNPDVLRLPSAHLLPYAWNEPERAGEDFPDAYAVHHWNHQRTLRREGLSHA